MELSEFVKQIVLGFLEDYVNSDGEPKYKALIDNINKYTSKKTENGEKPKVKIDTKQMIQEIKIYDSELGDAAESMEDELRELITNYINLRRGLAKGKIKGAQLKHDTVFITEEYLETDEETEEKDKESEEKPSLESLAKSFYGYVDEIDGKKVVVTKFAKYAYILIIYNYVQSGKIQVKKKQK